MQAERIISIKSLGIQNTIDIEVNNKKHIFYGNGIATSNSHAYSYALLGIWSSFLKAHFPLLFYQSWLSHAKYKLESKIEIKDLIRDAKHSGIKVNNPSLLFPSSDFSIFNGEIYFGLSNIKCIGESQYLKLMEEVNRLNSPIKNYTWNQLLVNFLPNLSKTVVTNLILVGGFDYLKYNRRRMIYEYNLITQLTTKELEQIKEKNLEKLIDSLKIIKVNKNRQKIIDSIIHSIQHPTASLEDNLVWLNKTEEDLLGIPLSVTKLETCETIEANTSCKEFLDGKSGEMILSVEVVKAKEITSKKGKNIGQKMAFLQVEDETALLDNLAVFPSTWNDFKNILYPGNTILLFGYKSKQNSLIVQKVVQI